MASKETHWYVCDKDICIVAEHVGDRRDRCIKHGAILTPRYRLNGLTRTEARKKLDEWERMDDEARWCLSQAERNA